MADGPRVSIVVLSYARPALLREALRSIVAQTAPDLEVVIVDNRSAASDAVAAVAREFPGVTLIAAERNLGFTGGMNRGLAACGAEWVLLTEDDVVLAPDCVERLLAFARTQPAFGLASGLLLNRGAGTIRCAGMRIGLDPVYRQVILGADDPDDGTYRVPLEVDAVPGNAILARRELLERLGGFRDDFFLYFEDVELSLRVRRRGLGVWVEPAARLWHREPADAPPDADVEFHKLKNLVSLYVVHAPRPSLAAFLVRYLVVDGARALGRDPPRARRIVRVALWALARVPVLLRDRRRERAIGPLPATGG